MSPPPARRVRTMLLAALEHARDQEVGGRHDWCDDPVVLDALEANRELSAARAIDWAKVSDVMSELEDRRSDPDPRVSVARVIADMLGVHYTEDYEMALAREAKRATLLLEGHYARVGVKQTPEAGVGIGIAQGICLAVAVAQVKDG